MDFRTHWGVDVVDFFQGKKGWAIFWEMFYHLPSHGKVRSKMASDPELAKALTAHVKPEDLLKEEDSSGERPSPPLEGYTLEIEKMNQLIDQIHLLRATIQAIVSKSKGAKQKISLEPRPKSEAEKILEQRKHQAGIDESKDLLARAGFKRP